MEKHLTSLATVAFLPEPSPTDSREITVDRLPPPRPIASPAERRAALQAASRMVDGDRDFYVSYAWGDDRSEDGHAREIVVEQLIEAARRAGIVVHRDRDVLKTGDLISEFMANLTAGDRIFVFISERYVRSFNCMFELSEVWRKCGQDRREFLARVRMFTLPCAKIWSQAERAAIAVHWTCEFAAVEALIREHGSNVVGTLGNTQHQKTRQIADTVADLLTLITDTLQAANFDDFIRHGFDGADTTAAIAAART